MKILVLSTAAKNAGDYLITNRCKALINKIIKNADLSHEYPIGKSIDDYVDLINKSYDAILVPGGPMSVREYPECVPLCKELNKISIPLIGVGLGWYGRTGMSSDVYSYRYSESTVKYLKKMELSIGVGCRDWHTYNTLKHAGINDVIMTGCPAWYDVNGISDLKVQSYSRLERIVVSDPAKFENKNHVVDLVRKLKEYYPNTEIIFVYHRGIEQDECTTKNDGDKNVYIKEKLLEIGVEVKNIAYSDEGFKTYDDCSLHVGYRVHAHIYCLSKGVPSILIEEDGRGSGVNDALGMRGICAYNLEVPRRHLICNYSSQNPFVFEDVINAINRMEKTNFFEMENAIHRIQFYYEIMEMFIKRIEKLV